MRYHKCRVRALVLPGVRLRLSCPLPPRSLSATPSFCVLLPPTPSTPPRTHSGWSEVCFLEKRKAAPLHFAATEPARLPASVANTPLSALHGGLTGPPEAASHFGLNPAASLQLEDFASSIVRPLHGRSCFSIISC